MTSLVIAEHNNSTLLGATYNTIAAAVELNADVHLLVAGNDCMAVAEQAAKAEGVNKVIVVQDSSLTHLTADSIRIGCTAVHAPSKVSDPVASLSPSKSNPLSNIDSDSPLESLSA